MSLFKYMLVINIVPFIYFRASIINITLALRMTKYLSVERDYIPWEAALRSLSSSFDLFDRSEVYGPMQVGSIKTSIKMINKKKHE